MWFINFPNENVNNKDVRGCDDRIQQNLPNTNNINKKSSFVCQ